MNKSQPHITSLPEKKKQPERSQKVKSPDTEMQTGSFATSLQTA